MICTNSLDLFGYYSAVSDSYEVLTTNLFAQGLLI